jgi:predicted transcriptional regulator
MQAITHSYQISAIDPQKILDGSVKSIVMKGYYTFPVFGLNNEIIELTTPTGKVAGHVAVKSFEVVPSEEVKEKTMTQAGFTSKDDFSLFTKDELLVTVAHVIPVIEEACQCGGECACGGDCQCKD